jgi:hypothetical protein
MGADGDVLVLQDGIAAFPNSNDILRGRMLVLDGNP